MGNEPIGQYYFDLASTTHPGKFEKYFKKTYLGEKGDDFDDFDFNFEEEIKDTTASDTLSFDSLDMSVEDSLKPNSDTTSLQENELNLNEEDENIEDVVTEEDEEAMFEELEDEDAGLE